MNDILKQIRQREADLTGRIFDADAKIFGQAADEIERLRAQVVALQSSLDAGPPRAGKKTPAALEREE